MATQSSLTSISDLDGFSPRVKLEYLNKVLGSTLTFFDESDSDTDSDREQKRAKTRPRPHSPPLPDDQFLDPRGGLYVDKTACITGLPDEFQYLVLRPPQFGKTSFLSTLYHFYDEPWRFGSLAVASASPTIVPHNQHLALLIRSGFGFVYYNGLDVISFLFKYAEELKIPNPFTYLRDERSLERKLVKVFERVKAHKYTLFVGVDDYDSPVRRGTLDPYFHRPGISKGLRTAREIENFLTRPFGNLSWKQLMFSARPPRSQWKTLLALQMNEAVGRATEDMTELRRLCGQHRFSSHSRTGEPVQPLLHPRLLDNPNSWVGRDCAADANETLVDPFELHATGGITWDDFRLAGALTYDGQSSDVLRVTNSPALSLIHSSIDDVLSARHNLALTFHNAWYRHCELDDHQLLLELAKPNLQGLLELIMRNRRCAVSVPAYFRPEEILKLKLTTLTLRGMWLGAHPNQDEPTGDELVALHEKLCACDDEEGLLDMPYRFWSPELLAMETRPVRSFFEDELTQ
ncbi:hypothetical protein R3P38DRAFT_3040467, partial [Favolaschia claudopus]